MNGPRREPGLLDLEEEALDQDVFTPLDAHGLDHARLAGPDLVLLNLVLLC